MRQRLSDKNARKLGRRIGLPVVHAMTRGGTDHRVDLMLEGGRVASYWPAKGRHKHVVATILYRDDEEWLIGEGARPFIRDRNPKPKPKHHEPASASGFFDDWPQR